MCLRRPISDCVKGQRTQHKEISAITRTYSEDLTQAVQRLVQEFMRLLNALAHVVHLAPVEGVVELRWAHAKPGQEGVVGSHLGRVIWYSLGRLPRLSDDLHQLKHLIQVMRRKEKKWWDRGQEVFVFQCSRVWSSDIVISFSFEIQNVCHPSMS